MAHILEYSKKALNNEILSQVGELFGAKQTYAYIIKDTPDSDWRTARERHKGVDKKLPMEWSSFYKHWYYLLPFNGAVVKSAYRNEKIVGRRPGNQDDRIVKDIDAPNANRPGSPYHPDVSMEGWASLITFIEENFGAHFIVVRSSKSNGYHIYVFFDAFESSDRIAHRAKEMYEANGFEMGQGKLETFPNVRANDGMFNGLRLPCITDDSYVVDPYTLERIGGIETFVELAQQKNSIRSFLGLGAIEMPKKVERTTPVVKEVVSAIAVEEPKSERKPFNLYKRMKWTDSNRSNSVLGAHVAYVIEHLGIIDPIECEQAVWESLHEYGYKRHASSEEQKDRTHVRRWIACRLKKGTHAPHAKVTGAGDARLNEIRSEDSKARFNYAIEAAKKAGLSFPSWAKMLSWVNKWLKQHYLATIGGTTWEKLKRAASNLILHTVDNGFGKGCDEESMVSTTTSPSKSATKPPFKSVFLPNVLELGQRFVSSVVELTGCDRSYVPQLIEYVIRPSPES